MTGSGTICGEINPCGSIQGAVNTATDGHYAGADVTIVVAAGTYTESDTISVSSLNSLTITGAGPATTTISGNRSGSVFNVTDGTVTISGLTITSGAGSLAAGGGGVKNTGTLTIDNSIVSNDIAGTAGTAASGGAIYNSGGMLTVTNSTLAGNSAPQASGGAIYNSGGMLTVTNSTLSGNSAASGGGIYNSGGGMLTVTNSTLSGNNAASGGGIYNSGGTLTVTNSTLSGNSAASGGGILGGVGSVNVAATILANGPSGGNCASTTGGGITDEGYNLADDATCGTIPGSATLDASLGALANNGGPTQTLLPALGSPAIGAIPAGAIVNSVPLCPRTDQRGVASSGTCTIGAVEGGFRIDTTSLPVVTPGSPYGPVQLTIQEAGVSAGTHVTTLKWKKVSLPKGLKLSKTGVLSGTPSTKLTAGTSSVTVSVTEKVTTLNGSDKKVVTKTPFDVAIPTFISHPDHSGDTAVQSILQLALTNAKTYYLQDGTDSYTGLDPTTWVGLDTGLTAVDGTTASTDPHTVSLLSSDQYVVFAVWSTSTSHCWSIIDVTDSSTLEGITGPTTIYISLPSVKSSQCSAATFNSVSATSGAVVSWKGWPPA